MFGILISIIFLFLASYWVRPKHVKLNSKLNTYYNYGIVLRILGTSAYIFYAFQLSDGSVDAFVYDNYALEFAEYFLRGDFSPFYDEKMWRTGQFFYTNFVAYPAALFLILTFNSTFGIYLLFSLSCFVGLVLLYKAFVNNYLFLDRRMIMLVVFLFPALWFWTSTIGKDSWMFLGMGLLCLGINNNRINYFYVAFGIFIMYAFRPPVAYISILAFGSFFILNTSDKFLMKTVKIGLGLFAIVFLLNYLSQEWGINEISNEELTELQQETLRHNDYGSGSLDEKQGGLSSIPRGVVDVLFRPFIWEIDNILSLASTIEINFVVILLLVKRKSVFQFIRNGLKHRLSTFALAFVGIYVVTIGLFENNIGIIARHRAIIFPFLFLMAFAYDDKVKRAYQQFLWRKRKQAVEKLTAETLRREEG